jgi:transcription initiation factor TFIIIB Brf1 subunit/transcription initiation factor TFIIB
MTLVCPVCNSRDIDFSEASGHSACMACGTVVEENTIVSSIEFQESGDRSSVVGQFVSATCSKQYASEGGGRYGNTRESRDATLAQARRVISQVASSLHLPPLYVDRAYRLYQIALERNFVFGRRQMHVVATCLYTICRQEKSPHLLIDFSDALQVNVFVLGSAFLKFSRLLNMPLPTVDPSLYIHRFAARLEMGDKMNSVITTALRIVTRLKKDWISTGRRPDGVCAAAMLIATRAHGFHKAQGEIAKLFRVSADTLKNRILDFKATPSAQLTVEQFHSNDTTEEYDPPSYIKNLVESLINDTDETGFSECENEDEEFDKVMTSDSEENNQPIIKKSIKKNQSQELVLSFSNSNKIVDDDDAVDKSEEIVRDSQNTIIGNVSVSVPIPGLSQKKPISSAKNKNIEAKKTLYGSMYSEIEEKEHEDNLIDTQANYSNSKSLKDKDESLSAIRVEAAINAAQGNEEAIRELNLEKKRKLKQLSLSNKKDKEVEGVIKIVEVNTRKISSKKNKTPVIKAKMVAFESPSNPGASSSSSSSSIGLGNNQNKDNVNNINDSITIEEETEESVVSILEDKDVDVYILTEEEQKKRFILFLFYNFLFIYSNLYI